MIFVLRLLLILALAHFVIRFVRGVVNGLRATRIPDRGGRRDRRLGIDEADIIDAEFTEVPDPPDDRSR
jgi:hypothetical protein